MAIFSGLPKFNRDIEPSNYDAYHRALRIITLCGWIPAFAFSLAHGIRTQQLFPVLGIIPMSFSAFIGGLGALRWVKRSSGLFLVDIFLTALLFGFLVPSWVKMSADDCYNRRYCYSGRGDGMVMVATYGTIPLMLNFGIHLYFVLFGIYTGMPFKMFAEQKCPHCNGDLSARHQRAMSEHSHDSKESYQSLNMIDNDNDDNETETGVIAGPASYRDLDTQEPRPSTDDETARLV